MTQELKRLNYVRFVIIFDLRTFVSLLNAVETSAILFGKNKSADSTALSDTHLYALKCKVITNAKITTQAKLQVTAHQVAFEGKTSSVKCASCVALLYMNVCKKKISVAPEHISFRCEAVKHWSCASNSIR